jgi:hypothetical protein
MRRGLTLPEVLLSLGLLAGALITLVSVLLTGLRLSQFRQQSTLASDLCRQVVERSKSLGQLPASALTFDGHIPTPVINGFPPASYPSQMVDGRLYTLQVEIAPLAGHPQVRQLRVRVRWGHHKNEVETYLYVF